MTLRKLMLKIEKHYASHGVAIKAELREVIKSSDRIIFQIKLKPGTRENMIFDRAPDIKAALHLPLFQPFHDDLDICLAVSEKPYTQNSLWEMLSSRALSRSKMILPIALGYDMRCEMVFDDLVKMTHAMYAGSTNSGKSVGLLCLILSLIMRQSVRNVNLMLFDVGANTMEPFDGIPHLSHPIVKDTLSGIHVIDNLVDEMERRIKLNKDELRKLPALVCVIDEYVSLIANIGDKKTSQKLTNSISNLLRRGRHGKIHMVLATQDPTIKNMKVDVGNITARMAFRCAKYHNSITILGEGGAEKLPGKGTMLYKSNGHSNPLHIQGAYISSDEVRQLVVNVKTSRHDLSNKFVIPELDGLQPQSQIEIIPNFTIESEGDKELSEIIIWVLGQNTVSAKNLMDNFRMGNRAYEIVAQLFGMKLITGKNANQPRIVIPQCVEDVPADVINFLKTNKVSLDDISAAFQNRAHSVFVDNQDDASL